MKDIDESVLAKLETVIPDIRTKASVVDYRLWIEFDGKYRLGYPMYLVEDEKFNLAEQVRRDIETLERKKKLVGEE
jgi:hypothetical protein